MASADEKKCGISYSFKLKNATTYEFADISAWNCAYLVTTPGNLLAGIADVAGYVEWKCPMNLAHLVELNSRIEWQLESTPTWNTIDIHKKGIQPDDEWDALNINGPRFGWHSDFVEKGQSSVPPRVTVTFTHFGGLDIKIGSPA